jgi:hypothetical protein
MVGWNPRLARILPVAQLRQSAGLLLLSLKGSSTDSSESLRSLHLPRFAEVWERHKIEWVAAYAVNRAGLKVVEPSTKTNDPANWKGLPLWGRTGTGSALYQEHLIETIAALLLG